MFDPFIDFVRSRYGNAHRIVEIGVGRHFVVVERLAEALPATEILATDKDPDCLRTVGPGRVRAVADDVEFPSLPLYEGAALLYSIRPPLELLPALKRLAASVGADLLVVPTADESEAFRAEGWTSAVWKGRHVGWLRTAPPTPPPTGQASYATSPTDPSESLVTP